MEFAAHYRQDPDGWKIHSLEKHLLEVGRLASDFASIFDSEKFGEILGVWHDLGKYSKEWQEYLKDKSGYYDQDSDEDVEDNVQTSKKIDHSTAGALYAIKKYGKIARILAYCIAGHHAGLPDFSKETGGCLEDRLSQEDLLNKIDMRDVPKEILDIELKICPQICPPKLITKLEYLHHWIRFIFSCLVDADFLDTENFMNPSKNTRRKNSIQLDDLAKTLDVFIENKIQNSTQSDLNDIRKQIYLDCKNNSKLDPGFFTFTVPTGGGKTLSGLSFALNHAVRHNKSRVIIVIPYTSIIEQTADIYRYVLGDDAIVEHHSNLDENKSTYKNKLRSENWDAPIIITTNVQFFESLFAARPSKCRKLHNIANSVIFFDEVQMLPPEFLKPIITAFKFLKECVGCSLVFSTATQPALYGRIGSNTSGFDGLNKEDTKELMTTITPDELSKKMKRVNLYEKLFGSKDDLIDALSKETSFLCIVDNRKLAKDLAEDFIEINGKQSFYHLSNNMCGQHKSNVIKEIREKLLDGEKVKVISTQLVECGVDFDFPVVYKRMSGLDSIAQAAGRCNRESKLQSGKVIIFDISNDKKTYGLLLQAKQVAESMFRTSVISFTPKIFLEYFEKFFTQVYNPDTARITDRLEKNANKLEFQFRSAAKAFKLIKDNTNPVVVPYDKGSQLIDLIKSKNTNNDLFSIGFNRKLQRYIVNLYDKSFNDLRSKGIILECNGIHFLNDSEKYSDFYGIII